MPQSPIELKGSNFTLSVIHLHHSQPDVIRQALVEKVEQAPAFFKNAPVVINIAHVQTETNWQALQQAISEAGLHVMGVSGCTDKVQKRAVLRAGLPLLSEGKGQAKSAIPQQEELAKTRIITTPIRSGQQIYARHGDLVVIGNVSAGAELIADGNIHIYGIMRGRALAGANGDTSSQIFCTYLAAELVSIAGQYWLSDQLPEAFYRQAARLFLNDKTLTVQSLS